jgi:hypothetical protein
MMETGLNVYECWLNDRLLKDCVKDVDKDEVENVSIFTYDFLVNEPWHHKLLESSLVCHVHGELLVQVLCLFLLFLYHIKEGVGVLADQLNLEFLEFEGLYLTEKLKLVEGV